MNLVKGPAAAPAPLFVRAHAMPLRLVVVGLRAALFAFCMLGSGLAAADDEGAPPASASSSKVSDEERDRQAEAIARSIMSPFCPGRTVSACPNAGPWRTEIRNWVSEGVEASEIKRRLAERVPEHNLTGVPKNRLGWVLPVGLAIGALGFLVFLLRYLVGPRVGARAAVTEPPKNAASSKADVKEPNETKGVSPDTGPTPPGASASEDWDARLDQELETLER